jgi:hypothetical protein
LSSNFRPAGNTAAVVTYDSSHSGSASQFIAPPMIACLLSQNF